MKDGHRLTDEQENAAQLIATGQDTKVLSGAGTGKTALLVETAKRLGAQRVRGLALVFNRRNADELKERLVETSFKGMTFNGLAFRSVGRHFLHRIEARDRMFQSEIADALGITRTLRVPLSVGSIGRVQVLNPRDQVGDVLDAVRRFSRSDAEQLGPEHFHRPLGIADDDWHLLLARLMPAALRMWADVTNVNGVFPYEQDYYVRQYLDRLRDGAIRDRYEVVLADECFPAGTMVATPQGDVAIESLHAGDEVLAIINGKVASAHVTTAYATPRSGPLVRVWFADGTSLTCTGNHPVRVEGGWVPAAWLEPGQAVRCLRNPVLAAVGDDVEVLLTAVPARRVQAGSGDLDADVAASGWPAPGAAAAGRRRRPRGVPADARARAGRADAGTVARDRPPAGGAGRERYRLDAAAGDAARRARLGMERRACRPDPARSQVGLPDALQARPGQPDADDRRRGRRRLAWSEGPTRGRRAEGRVPALVRVDRVEVLEPGRGPGPGGDRYDGHVYTLSTTAGRYVADGVSVKNCQDLSACRFAIAELVGQQRVAIGDTNQSIYGWNGAEDFMSSPRTDGWAKASLTGSFRFGDGIAEVANSVLAYLPTEMRMRGLNPVASEIGDVKNPDALLCRSNKGVMLETLAALLRGGRPYVVGGVDELVAFAQGALELQDFGGTAQVDLRYFSSWAQAIVASKEEAMFRDLELVLEIVDELTPRRVLAELARVESSERNATVVVSTAHRFKGMEADSVRLGPDFEDDPSSDEEHRIIYVAVTRARRALDVSPALCFVDGRYAPGEAQRAKVSLPGSGDRFDGGEADDFIYDQYDMH